MNKIGMNKKSYYKIVSVIFAIITALHLLRAVNGWEATLAGVSVPLWISWAAVLIAGYLSVRGWQFAKKN